MNRTESLEDLSRKDIAVLLNDDVTKMIGYDQRNPHHCVDLWKHSLYTVNNIENNDSNLLRVAAFFHDIGKSYIAKEKVGRVVYYGDKIG